MRSDTNRPRNNNEPTTISQFGVGSNKTSHQIELENPTRFTDNDYSNLDSYKSLKKESIRSGISTGTYTETYTEIYSGDSLKSSKKSPVSRKSGTSKPDNIYRKLTQTVYNSKFGSSNSNSRKKVRKPSKTNGFNKSKNINKSGRRGKTTRTNRTNRTIRTNFNGKAKSQLDIYSLNRFNCFSRSFVKSHFGIDIGSGNALTWNKLRSLVEQYNQLPHNQSPFRISSRAGRIRN